jgi:hypothetical protein
VIASLVRHMKERRDSGDDRDVVIHGKA